jgi:hypothetical protein
VGINYHHVLATCPKCKTNNHMKSVHMKVIPTDRPGTECFEQFEQCTCGWRTKGMKSYLSRTQIEGGGVEKR